MSYVPVCVNSLGCGITGQHTAECLERMVSGLWEEQLRMQPVIEAARAYVEWVDGDGDWEVDPELTLIRATRHYLTPCVRSTTEVRSGNPLVD